MAHLFDSAFIDVSVPVLRRIKGPLPFNVFLKRASDTYTKIFPKDEPIDLQRLLTYQQSKGIEDLFVQKEDYRQYLFYVEQVATDFLANSKEVLPEELTLIVKEMADLTMIETIIELHVDPASVEHASQTVRGCIELLGKEPKSLVKILKMMGKHPYLMKHSIATSIFALLLTRSERLESKKTLLSIGLGALFHDFGITQLPFDPEDKTELSPQEWKEIKEHPALGKRLLDPINAITTEIKTIVLQHHEQPNGAGYPNGLHDKEIYYPAKIVAIAESFSALVSKRPFREAFLPHKAIEIMFEDRGKFDDKILKQFSKFFFKTK